MFCKKCGKQIADDSIFCNYCGKSQSAETKPKNTVTWYYYQWTENNKDELLTDDLGSDEELVLIDTIEAPNNKEAAIIVLQQKHPDAFKAQIVCPFCGSTQIQVVVKKWDILTGILTNKTCRVCVRCNRKF